MFLAQGNTTTSVASHFPINTAGSTGAMRVKFLAQGNNSKQLYLGIEPGSVGSQADPKPLKPQLPHELKTNVRISAKNLVRAYIKIFAGVLIIYDAQNRPMDIVTEAFLCSRQCYNG